jgi:hypothetical protein
VTKEAREGAQLNEEFLVQRVRIGLISGKLRVWREKSFRVRHEVAYRNSSQENLKINGPIQVLQ